MSRPTNVVRLGVALVCVLGVVVILLVGSFGLAGLDALVPGPAPSLDAAAYRVAISAPAFTLSLVLVGGVSLFVAGMTMWVSGRGLTDDLRYVDAGIDAMVRDDALVASIPLRTLDELGALVRDFEMLRRDFGDALERERDLRRELERADAVKAEFLKAVSHELRTPLNSILGFADVLLEEIDGKLTTPQREDLEIIRTAGQHLLELFNDVFDLSAAVTDQLRLERVRLNLAPLFDEIARELRGLKGARTIQVVVDVAPELPLVNADPKRVRQILTNLASNALKFTDAGEVRIQARLGEDGWIEVRVIDTGVGIPEDSREEIFVEFGQAIERGMRKRGRGGAGLGLAITKRLVELHGGTIHVDSTVGRGSTFSLTLPVWEDA
ncbi:MAG: ATP-binding protein [Myxococcota bacterium]